jgi:hypothetical protein
MLPLAGHTEFPRFLPKVCIGTFKDWFIWIVAIFAVCSSFLTPAFYAGFIRK